MMPSFTEAGARMSWWWLSFADGERPKGQQFLGGLLVEANSFEAAHACSLLLGLNPGGECKAFEVPPEYEPRITPDMTYRLLSRNDCEEIEKRWPHPPQH